ncbi:hypothetical protein [Serratia fonticola]|uniref:hypothetical protein n=1 Tax=Serratia fonticola TaxID=47917 RepID=UPI0013778723|nr:hypothetical protein [Serratia fonticola]NBJ36733.1 hypothetical protein [Serratia fonticola]
MEQSLQSVIVQEKSVGASWLTAQACSFYAGVSAAVGDVPPRGYWCVQVAPALM